MNTKNRRTISRHRFLRQADGAVGAALAVPRIIPASALGHGPAATAVLRQALNKTNDSETHKAGERALKGRAAKTPAGK
ncbi:MAG: hypothetical protein ACLQVY_00405 [Limisphaerales bacterium]